MNGFIHKTLRAVAGLAGVLAVTGGCVHYDDLVDPCYPERYTLAARQEICAGLSPQVANGHALDQTVWNYHFEAGNDRLTPGGLEHLAYLARRRPTPDPMVFVQTAHDIAYDPANPDKMAEARTALDNRRIASVRNYLKAAAAGRGIDFQVAVHDPGEVGQSALAAGFAAQKAAASVSGALQSSGASTTGGGGGVSSNK